MNDKPQDIETERAETEAADWLVRLQSDGFADVEVLEFERWLTEPSNQAAFERAQALWSDLDAAADLAPSPVVQFRPARKAAPHWTWAAGAAIAAALAVVVFVPRAAPPPAPAVFEAAKGENRKVDLADGSHVHLGGGSRMIVRLGKSERRVELASADGEAAFDVAKDPGRPFVIVAGDHSITVVGTEFDVRRAAGRLMVTVRRGIVEVAALAPGSRPVRLTPGQEFSHRDGENRSHVATVDPGVAFGWTTGERTYRDQPLPEVVADLNRYFAIPLQVDAAAADLRFTGFLKIDEEDAVVRRLQAFLPITAMRIDGAIVLRHAPG